MNIKQEIVTGVIQSQQYNLKYKIEGKGIPAIVTGSATYYPRTFSQQLREYFRFIFLDHYGFVPTQEHPSKDAYSLEKIVANIEYTRQKLGLGKIVIVGHSGHGFMALEYAKLYPDSVLGVCLIGMGTSNSPESHALANQYFEDSVCPDRKAVLQKNLKYLQEALAAAPEKAFITYCLRLGARSWYDFNFDATALWEGVEVNMPIIDYLWGEVFRDIDISRNLEVITCPTYLGLGKFDYLVAPFYTWNPIRSKFKNLTIRLFEKSGHTPQYEEPEAFDTSIIEWLANNSINKYL